MNMERLDQSAPERTATELHPDLRAFLDAGDRSPEAVNGFLHDRQSPLAAPGALTFLWRGEAVGLRLLRWIHAGVDQTPFARIPGTDLWYLAIPAVDGGRFEYKLNVTRADGEHWILDPMNPHRAADPFGENSVAMSHGYARPDWSLDQGAPAGRLDEIGVESRIFATTRRERVYLPHGYDRDRPYPLLIVHDGGDYEAYADLTRSLDNLIHRGDIPPLVAVLSQADDRMSEYPRGRRHARYVATEMLPAIRARYAISDDPGERVLLGASLGAVASLATAFRFPGLFGGLILKSGSFILDPDTLRARTHPVFHRVARLIRAIERAPNPAQARVFISTGELEGLADQNRALAEALRARGVDVRFQSSWDGHHWHNWRDQLRDALMWVLSPELNE